MNIGDYDTLLRLAKAQENIRQLRVGALNLQKENLELKRRISELEEILARQASLAKNGRCFRMTYTE